MDLRVVLILMIICLFIGYQYLTKHYEIWKKYNIQGPKPCLFFGNIKDVLFGKIHLLDCIRTICNQFPSEQVIGSFVGCFPFLIVKDPDLIQEVLIKNFSNFGDRGFTNFSDIDPLSQHLLYLTVDKWKPMRQKLSPVFSSTRLKEMFYLISECADKYVDYTQKLVTKNKIVDCLELSSKFTLDVIGVCAFGLETNTFSQEKSEFERVGEIIFESNVRGMLKRLVRICPHWVLKIIQPFIKKQKLLNFFINLIEENMTHRKKNNIRRNDFVDLLMDIKENLKTIGEEEMTMELLTAQAYVFFVAGFDTSSNTITHTLYEMALNPTIQNQLRDEINSTMQRSGGKLNYDNIKNMKYLDQVLKESLRKYPPAYFTARKAVADFTFPGTKITVHRGIRILIPIHTIQNDPNYYPEPDKFDPQRFTEGAEKMRHPMTFIPFGAGPRRCIGERFAFITTKLGIAKIISRFKFEICDKTCYEKKMGKFLLSPKGELFLKLTDISHG